MYVLPITSHKESVTYSIRNLDLLEGLSFVFSLLDTWSLCKLPPWALRNATGVVSFNCKNILAAMEYRIGNKEKCAGW